MSTAPDEESWPEPLRGPRSLAAFGHRDFAIFWVGALVSNTGSWLQNLTVPYVVFQLTGSALWVGVATAAQFLPGFAASPLGGHLADTQERRRLLLVALTSMSFVALGLWWDYASGAPSVPAILAIVALGALIWGATLPTWQAFVNDLVPRDALVSAVSLNSLQFNAARSLGPALAGIIIAVYGAGVAFALNALSYVVVVVALLLVRTRSRAAASRPRLWSGFVEAVRYVPTQPGLVAVVCTVAIVGLLGTPAFSFTVVFAGSVYDVGPVALGVLNTALGVGAVLAVPIVVRAKSGRGLAGSLWVGLVMQGAAIVAFGVSPNVAVGAVALTVVGLGFLLSISSGNTALQLIVAQRLRGRVMALRLMAYMAATSIGAMLLGAVSGGIGPRLTMVLAGAVLLVVAAVLRTRRGARFLAHVDDAEDTG